MLRPIGAGDSGDIEGLKCWDFTDDVSLQFLLMKSTHDDIIEAK